VKKVFVVSVIIALVMAFGGYAMAEGPDYPYLNNHLGEDFNINLIVNVSKFAHIGFLDDAPMVFDLEKPDNSGDTVQQTRDIHFATNTDVFLYLEEDISTNIKEALGIESDDVTGAPLVVLPYLQEYDEEDGEDYGLLNSPGASNHYAFSPGHYQEELRVHIGWNSYYPKHIYEEYPHLDDMAWDSFSWWLLEDGEYEGTLTVTIQAQ